MSDLVRPAIRTVVVGLGATGLAITQALAAREDVEIVAALDVRPELAGVALGSLVEGAPQVLVASALDEVPEADVAVVATTSWLRTIEPVVVGLLERGINVLSICEELRDPTLSHPDIVARLDDVACAHGVSVLGTGCNPGMLMDTLPIVLSGLTTSVERVVIRRMADMRRYGAILAKFGLGLSPAEFDERRRTGDVMGHVGFAQSIAALANGLGWNLDSIEVDVVDRDLVTSLPRHGEHISIPAGSVASVVHRARGHMAGQVVIDLETRFGIFEPADEIRRGDSLTIVGEEQTIEVTAADGYESFLSTVAMACNAVTAVVDAAPGFRTLLDLPISTLASKGARSASRPLVECAIV